MNAPSRIITLTTDFGTSDAYVGIMKGVILGINPGVQVVDLTHAIPPQDIHEAAFTIYSAYRYFPKNAIHTIVVDPGVGTHRQAIVCEIEDTFFVCPDNGVLSYVLQDIGNNTAFPMNAVAIQNASYFLPEISDTFHGRDIFAPVAAHLSLGVPLTNIGPSVQDLVEFPILTPQVSKNRIIGQIIKLDRFGNAITNISERTLTEAASAYDIRVADTRLTRLNRAYAESTVGEPLAIIGSLGVLEIAINGGSAEVGLGLKWGDVVEIQWSD
ncbi:hypothetical protein C6503_24490 [Candidatus Poribacteria bacterium]|nr:MAG: hypothetical protein C6503_24490 [Candidatus Poribacteria bacterium]